MLPAQSIPRIDSHRVRSASVDDIPLLLRLESQFPTDRISRRSFLYLLRRAHADVLVVDGAGSLLGDAVVLYRRGVASARLYSIVVALDVMRIGIGRILLESAEAAARAHGRTSMVLEVREDNLGALALYQRTGYRNVKRIPGYYQDGAAGLRLVKPFDASSPL